MSTEDTGRRGAANRRLLRAVERARAWDDDDARRWRDATDAERIAAFFELQAVAEIALASRGFALEPEPLTFPRLASSGRRGRAPA